MSTSWKRTVPILALLLAAFLAGCGGGGGGGGGGDDGSGTPQPAPAAADTVRVTIRGAVLESSDGAKVDIPPSASVYEYDASISRSSDGAPPLPPGLAPMGALYSLQPHGAVFTMPIRISLPFDAAAVPAGATVKVARGEPGGRWEILPGTIEGSRISVATRGFSYYMPIIMQTAIFTFPATTPFGQVTMAGQTPVAAQTPRAFFANGDPNDFVPVLNYNVYTQAQLATPLALTLRGAVPAGSDLDLYCGTREVRLVVTAFTARVYPDPADAGRTLVRSNRMVRMSGGFGYDDPVELASLPVPRDGQTRSLSFNVNLAHHGYQLGPDDYPPDPWTGGPARFDSFWGGPDPLPLTGAAGLTLATHYTCSDNSWFTEYDRSPQTALRRGFADSVAFTGVPVDQTVVEGEPVTFRASLAARGSSATTRSVVVKWQRALAGAPDLWFDLDPDTTSEANMAGWATSNRTNFVLWPDGSGLLTRSSVTRAEHNGNRVRAVACEYTDNGSRVTQGACVASPSALLTVTQDFVAPQVLTHPTPQITVRESAAGQVTQFSATFSGVPRPAVHWETKAPGSPAWAPVDAATHTQNGATLSTTRAFTLADRGREYRAVASNAGGSTSTFSSVLFVTTGLEAPAITTQPQDASVAAGSAVLFATSVTGSAPMSYQWFFNGTAIPGANGPLLTLNNVNAGNAGTYQLEASNRENRVRTRAARLTVGQPSGTPPAVAAPKILTPPAKVTVTAGNTATFAVGAQGGAPLRYQWFRDGQPIEGAMASALTIASVRQGDAGAYAVTVANEGGRARSDDVALTVLPAGGSGDPPPPPVAPAITTPPTGLAVSVGQGATLAVAASGSAPLAYQWRRNGVPITGATGPILALASATADDAGQYSVVVSNAAGQATSADAGLVVTPPPGAPTITAQPAARSVLAGEAASFVVDVAGSPAPVCQWLRNGAAAGAAGPCGSFTLATTSLADHGAVFSVVVVNTGGFVVSAPAILSVTNPAPPQITMQPADLQTTTGGDASFRAAASGQPAPEPQWWLNGQPLPMTFGAAFAFTAGGCTGDYEADAGTLVLRAVAAGCDAAQVVFTATQGGVTATSRTATLTVTAAPPAGALTATQLVAGHEWSMVLRPDRTVWGWGGLHKVDGSVVVSNLAPADQARRPVRMYPAVLTDVRQIAGWYDAFWALKGEPGTAASRVLHWGNARSATDGRGADGAGNLGPLVSQRINAVPVELLERRSVGGVLQAVPVDRVCSIAATSDRILMIRAQDGFGSPTDCAAGSAKTVWVAGTLAQFGADAIGVVVPVQGLPAGIPAQVIAAQQTAQSSAGPVLVRMEDGRLFGWGTNIGNLFGLPLPATQGYVGSSVAPQALPSPWGAASDAAFTYVGLFATRADGSAVVSGRNDGGELGLGPQPSGTVNHGPLPLLASDGVPLDGVQALISSQVQVSLALRQGRILAWGAANQPMQGGSPVRIDYPRLLPASGDGWRALSAGHAHALALAANGAVYTWGNGLRGALGNGLDSGNVLAPTMISTP